MISQVNKIIANQLLKREGVYLPTVGSLYVDSRPARFVNKKEVTPPLRLVEFTSEQQGLSLIEIIQTIANIDGAGAEDIYTRWLERVTSEQGIVIEGVGVLSKKFLIMDESFAKILNPQSSKIIKQSKKGHLFVWGIAIVAILFGSYIILTFTSDFSFNKSNSAVESEIQKKTDDILVEKENLPQKNVVKATTDNKKATESAPPIKKKTSQIENLTSKQYYVVAGVFSIEANAIRAIKSGGFENSGGVYRFGSKFMAAYFVSSDRPKARAFQLKHRPKFEELWIYQAK